MTDQVLNILKFVLLGMLYLFFARVLWAVWSEVRTPRGPVAAARTTAARQPSAAGPTAPTTPTPRPAAPTKGKAKGKAKRPPKGKRGTAARLVVLEPRQRRGLTFALTGELTLGRDAGCAIPIEDDSYVSQLHLRFYDYEGQPMVEDLGSTNGTFLNGNRLHGAKLLHPGDRIQVGTNVIEAQ
ncbi:MAG: FHA domain-containing protein [Ilumatobacteraceae bacterium]